MNHPGPPVLGRGIVLPGGAAIPSAWSGAPQLDLDQAALDDSDRLGALLGQLQLAWVHRRPTVITWSLPSSSLPDDEPLTSPVWQLSPGFLPANERLAFLLFTNNYDARSGDLVWWWAKKAIPAIGAQEGGNADVLLDGDREVWIDGGPRQPLPTLEHPVISGESIELRKTTFVRDAVEPAPDELAPDQREAIGHVAGPARVIAPAGSGKTRTLAARLRHLLDDRRVEPEHCVAVAYNAKAAQELRERLGLDRRLIRTIHSLGWEILQEAHGPLDLIDEREVRVQLGKFLSVPRRANADPLAPHLESLDLVRAALMDPADAEGLRDDIPGFADAFDQFRADMYRRRRVDHGEQVYGAIEALVGDPALRRAWQRRCRHMLVDEFQDLTPSYLLMLRLLASPQLQVFGVGDDDQVIYGYAGADPGYLIDFDEYFPGAGHFALATNYRCPVPVVNAANHLLSYNRRRIAKATVAGPMAVESGDSLLVERLSSDDLAHRAARHVETWLGEGVAPSDIAVLARVNSTLIPVKAALGDLAVPTTDLLSAGLLRRTGLRALFAWLRIGLQPDLIRRDDVMEVIRRPARGLTTIAQEIVSRSSITIDDLIDLGTRLDEKRSQKWRDFGNDLREVVTSAESSDAVRTIELIVESIGLGRSAHALDSGRGNAARSSHFDELAAVRRAAAIHSELGDFMPWLADRLDRPAAPDGVTLSSVHRVKGMEWKRVIVFGADRGAMPHDLAEDVEEERRVFHVALTRSIDQAVILAADSRPSRFLGELSGTAPRESQTREPRPQLGPRFGPSIGDTVKVRGGYVGRVTGASGRMVLVKIDTGVILNVTHDDVQTITERASPTPDANPALVESLRRWRLATSTDLGVPAFVVFDDKTMRAIAAAQPRNETELIEVRGIGPAKLDAYGDEILSIVDGFAAASETEEAGSP